MPWDWCEPFRTFEVEVGEWECNENIFPSVPQKMCSTRLCFIGGLTSASVHRTDSDLPWPPAEQRLWTLLIQHSTFFIFVLPHFGPLSPAVLNPAWVTCISISSKCPNHQPMYEPLNCNTVTSNSSMGLPGLWPLCPSLYLIKRDKKSRQNWLVQISLHLHQIWESSTQVLEAEYQAPHKLAQQDLRCQNWNPLPSRRQSNKRQTEAAKQLFDLSLERHTVGTGTIQELLNCSVHVLNGEVLVSTSTAREKLLTEALTWSFKMIAGTSTMPFLLQTPCDQSEPFTAGLAVIIMLFPALSETWFGFLDFRQLYQGRFLYPPIARVSYIRGKWSLKCFNCMRKNITEMLDISLVSV